MLMSKGIQGALFATMCEAGMDYDAQHEFLEAVVPGVESFKFVTSAEAHRLLEVLNTQPEGATDEQPEPEPE